MSESEFMKIRRTQMEKMEIVSKHLQRIKADLGEGEDAHVVIFYSAPVPGTDRSIMAVQSDMPALQTSHFVSTITGQPVIVATDNGGN